MFDFVLQPWPWWISGILIAAIMFLLIYFGQTFGFSSNLRTLCAAMGAGKKVAFFAFDWREQTWNLVFLVGAVIGGFLTQQFLTEPDAAVQISQATVQDLAKLGFAAPQGAQPDELFGLEALSGFKNILLLVIGGALVGFGARYAGGCTSGHAITGLSNLQLPSLIATVGFFLGGLIMTFLIFPRIF